jgi:hypothetical protein
MPTGLDSIAVGAGTQATIFYPSRGGYSAGFAATSRFSREWQDLWQDGQQWQPHQNG